MKPKFLLCGRNTNLSAGNFKKYFSDLDGSTPERYGQKILVSGYPVLRAVRCFEKTVYHKFSKHAFEENLGPTQYTYWERCNCTDSLINIQYNYLKALGDRECRYVRLFAMDFVRHLTT